MVQARRDIMATEKTGVYIYGVSEDWSGYSVGTSISKFEVPGSEFTFTGEYRGDSITGYDANNILVCNANVTYSITANSNMCVYDTKVYGLGHAVNLTGGNAEIIDSYFSDSTYAALRITAPASTVMVSGSTFATSGDVIDNAGALTFKNTNYIGAALEGNGSYILADGATLVFDNASAISVADLTFGGNNTLKFTGTGRVTFAATETFTDVTLQNGDGKTVAVKTGLTIYGSDVNLTNVYLPDLDIIVSGSSEGNLSTSISGSNLLLMNQNVSVTSAGATGDLYIYNTAINFNGTGNYYGKGFYRGGGTTVISGSTFSMSSTHQGVNATNGAFGFVNGGNVVIKNSLFIDNKANSGGGGAFGSTNAGAVIEVSGSTFAKQNDTIYVSSGSELTFEKMNYFNASIFGTGTYTLADNAKLVFGNSGYDITVVALNFGNDNNITLAGTGKVGFTNTSDFSGVSITVDASKLDVYTQSYTLATGLDSANIDKITIINDAGNAWKKSLSGGTLSLTNTNENIITVTNIYGPAENFGNVEVGTAVKGFSPEGCDYIFNGIYKGDIKSGNPLNSLLYKTTISGDVYSNSKVYIIDSVVTGSTNGVRSHDGSTITICNTLFYGNTEYSFWAREANSFGILSGSTFYNKIYAEKGSITFQDTNYISAAISKAADGKITLADNAKLVFNNEGYQIRVEELNFGNNNTLVLSGGHNGVNGNVDFANTNVFTNVDVVVDTDNMTFDNVDKKYQLAYALVSPKSISVTGAYKDFWEAFPANNAGNTQARLKNDIADTIVIDALGNGNAKLSVLGKDVETTTANAYALALKFIKSNGTLTLNDWQTIDGNGVNLNDLTVKLNNVNYTNCSGGNGGGFSGNAALTVKGGEFVSNNASNNGGAINVSGVADISGVEFTGNNAVYNGGAVYVGSSGTVQISDSTFTGNIAGQRGGAVLSEALSGHESRLLTVFNSNFTGNEALYGGAVRAEIGSLVVRDTIFDGNTSDSGGALYLEKSVAATISGSTFCGNIAAVGGAIASFLSSETLTIDGSTKAVIFDGNSSGNGISGAIFSAYGKIVLTGDVQFLQSSDSIYVRNYQDLNYTGTLEITDANVTLNASLQTKFNLAESGITVNSSSITFDNTEAINVAALAFTGTNTINLNGEVVNFTGQDLSGVNITVDTTGFAGGFKTIASGVAKVGNYTAGDYKLSLINNELILHDSVVNDPLAGNGIKAENNGTDLLTTITGDFAKDVYGGSKTGTDGALLIDFNAGKVDKNIVGGGIVSTPSTAVHISGTAEVGGSVYAGMYAITASLPDMESSSLTVSGGTLNDYCVAGSLVANVEHHTGVTTLNINDGTFADGIVFYNAGYLIGGGKNSDIAENAAAKLTVTSAVTNLNGDSVNGLIFGGAHARQNGYAKVDAVEINITGGSYDHVFGGGWAEKGSRSEVGSVNITIDGGYVANLYAGGSNAVSSSYGASGAVVTGDIAITVSTYDTLGNIYLCGEYTNSAVLGNVTLTLAGDNTIDLISGAGVNGVADANGITRVEVMGNVSCGEIDEIDQLAINESATLTMTGNFSGKSLELLTDGVLDDQWDILSASNIADLVDSLIFNIAGQDYSFESLAAGVDGIGIKLGIEENKLFAVSK